MTRLGLLCDRILEAGWLAALVSIPLYFNIYSSRVFEPDKLVVLRAIVLTMCMAYVVRFLEAQREESESGTSSAQHPGSWSSALRAANPLALPAFALAVIYILASVFSISPSTSFWGSYQRLQGTYTNLTYIVLFFIVAHNLRSKQQIDRFVKVALLTSVPVSLYGLAQNLHLDPLPWGGDVTFRVASSMGNAIFVAAYLIMIVPLAMARLVDAIWHLWRWDKPRSTSGGMHLVAVAALLVFQNVVLAIFVSSSVGSPNLWWGALPAVGLFLATSISFIAPSRNFLVLVTEVTGYVLLLLLQLAAIALSGSRGPWIGLGVGIFVFIIILAVRRGNKAILILSSALAGIVAAFLILMNVPGTPLAPLKSVPYLGRLGQLTETEGGTGKVRVLIWQGAKELLTTYPSIGLEEDPTRILRPLLGYGPETMYVAFNKVYPPDLAHYEARNATPDRSHMDVLDHLVMTGILGTVAFFAVLGVGLTSAWRTVKLTQSVATQTLLVGIISAVVAHFVESLVGIAIASTLTYMWALFGLAVAIRCIEMRREDSASSIQTSNVLATAAQGVAVGAAPVRLALGTRKAKRAKVGNGAKVGATIPKTSVSTDGGTSDRSPILHRRSDLTYASGYVLATVVGLLYLSKSKEGVDVWWYYVAGFIWLVIGIIAVALSLGTLPRGSWWRKGNLWIYLPLGMIILLLIGMNLNQIVADIHYKRGFSLDAQRQFDQAIPAYQEALKLAPNQDFYYLFLGRAFLELGKGAQKPNINPPLVATSDTVRRISLPEVARLGRDDLLELGRASLEEARVLNPLNTDHYANLARLHRYWAELGDRQKLDVSVKYYTQATTLSPQAAHLWAEWSEVYLAKGQPAEAIERAKIGLNIDPIYPMNYVYLGDAYLATEKTQEALEVHLRAIELDPLTLSDPRLENRVSAYQQAGLLDRFESGYRLAAQSERGRGVPAVRSAYGYILSRLGKPGEALQEFRAWVQLSPRDWLARRNLAVTYDALGMFDEAIAEATEAKKLAPTDQQTAMQNWIADLQKRKK